MEVIWERDVESSMPDDHISLSGPDMTPETAASEMHIRSWVTSCLVTICTSGVKGTCIMGPQRVLLRCVDSSDPVLSLHKRKKTLIV